MGPLSARERAERYRARKLERTIAHRREIFEQEDLERKSIIQQTQQELRKTQTEFTDDLMYAIFLMLDCLNGIKQNRPVHLTLDEVNQDHMCCPDAAVATVQQIRRKTPFPPVMENLFAEFIKTACKYFDSKEPTETSDQDGPGQNLNLDWVAEARQELHRIELTAPAETPVDMTPDRTEDNDA